MKDTDIVELFWRRDERAIEEAQTAYGTRLTAVACRILDDREDSAESVNDAYWRAWNSIPPHRPANLQGYLCHLVRQIAVDRLRARHAQKRPRTEYALSLEELSDCVGGGERPDETVETAELTHAIERFLWALPAAERQLFLRRYFFLDPIRTIADAQGCSVSRIKSRLFRLRERLRIHLEQEGYSV